MASRIITKKGSGAPLASDLVHGELAVDTVNKRLYTEDAGGTVIEVGTNPTSITTGNFGASGTIDLTGATVSNAGSITTADINGGTIDGTVIGGTTPAAVTTSSLVATTADINAGTIDNTVIGGSSEAAGTFTTGQFNTSLNVDGPITADGLTVANNTGSTITLSSTDVAITGGEILGKLDFYSADGSGIGAANRASIEAIAADAAGAGDVYIKTSTGGASVSSRVKIANNGDISFYEDTGTTAKFFWDASAESLGIGTVSPSYPLTVRSTGTSTTFAGNIGARVESNGSGYSSTLQFSNSVDASATVGLVGTSLGFGIGTTEKMRIDSSGNVGIGTSSPAARLDVDGQGCFKKNYSYASTNYHIKLKSTSASGISSYIGNVSSVDRMNISAGGYYYGASLYQLTDGATGMGTINIAEDGTLTYQSITGATADSIVNPSERMRIDSSGNVGIGTGSPASLVTGGSSPVLSIGGTDGDLTTGEKAGALSFITSDGSYTGTFSDGITGEIVSVAESATGAAYGLAFYTGTITGSNRGERVRIDNTGNVGIGTDSPDTLLEIVGADPILTIRDTETTGALTNATLRLAESAASDTLNNYWDINHTANANLAFKCQFGASAFEAMRLDGYGNLLVGKTITDFDTAGSNLAPAGNVNITRSGAESLNLNRLASDGAIIDFYRGLSTKVGSIGSSATRIYIASGDTGLRFVNDDIRATNGSGTDTDGTKDLGDSAVRFNDIYATNGTIQTSDRNEKQDIEELSEAEQRVAVACKGLLRKFRWKSSVEEKGDDARIHFGIIAQDLQAAFEAEGLDAGRYAMFIHSTWTDEETGEERSRMGVRYSELLAFIIAAI